MNEGNLVVGANIAGFLKVADAMKDADLICKKGSADGYCLFSLITSSLAGAWNC